MAAHEQRPRKPYSAQHGRVRLQGLIFNSIEMRMYGSRSPALGHGHGSIMQKSFLVFLRGGSAVAEPERAWWRRQWPAFPPRHLCNLSETSPDPPTPPQAALVAQCSLKQGCTRAVRRAHLSPDHPFHGSTFHAEPCGPWTHKGPEGCAKADVTRTRTRDHVRLYYTHPSRRRGAAAQSLLSENAALPHSAINNRGPQAHLPHVHQSLCPPSARAAAWSAASVPQDPPD